MSGMRRLTIIIAGCDAERFDAATAIAAAYGALGGAVRCYAHQDAVPLLARTAPPERAAAIRTAQESGVEYIACQSGLAAHGLTADGIMDGIVTAGLIHLLADADDDRLLTV